MLGFVGQRVDYLLKIWRIELTSNGSSPTLSCASLLETEEERAASSPISTLLTLELALALASSTTSGSDSLARSSSSCKSILSYLSGSVFRTIFYFFDFLVML